MKSPEKGAELEKTEERYPKIGLRSQCKGERQTGQTANAETETET